MISERIGRVINFEFKTRINLEEDVISRASYKRQISSHNRNLDVNEILLKSNDKVPRVFAYTGDIVLLIKGKLIFILAALNTIRKWTKETGLEEITLVVVISLEFQVSIVK